MTAGFNFNNYAAGFCSATPALRGNSTARNQYAETRTRHHRARLYR
ncbi:hypothetical protein AWP94_25915 [Escherichia coli]|nr:hypothetical protein ACN67_11080 [Escherichia coli]OKT82060.1 hypothetical protein ACN75_25815 [Escherichia coli]OKT83327.1 hypothetical protein ACN75_25125 [Escherichia coli]OKV60840.1 hypothetical protein AWP61_20715 [Escherichia coli]OKX53819.1 hypothetical protein AWP94_25915 [Escherichia coli]